MEKKVDVAERHYTVIRYYPHPGHGLMKEVLAENLTLSEAEKLAEENRPVISEEDVVIQDQFKSGLEAEFYY